MKHTDKINETSEMSWIRSLGRIRYIFPGISLIFTCLLFTYLISPYLSVHLHPFWKWENKCNHYEYRINMLLNKESSDCSFLHFSVFCLPLSPAVHHHWIQMKDSGWSIQQSTNDYLIILQGNFLQSKCRPLTRREYLLTGF